MMGSVLFASDADGVKQAHVRFDPWGNLLGDKSEVMAGMNIHFTNHNYDHVIDKYHAQARFYDAANGRMMSLDPAYSDANLYRYCLNNPVNYVDPDGRTPKIVLPGIVVFLLGQAAAGAVAGAIEEVLWQHLIEGRCISEIDIDRVIESALIGAGKGLAGGIIRLIIRVLRAPIRWAIELMLRSLDLNNPRLNQSEPPIEARPEPEYGTGSEDDQDYYPNGSEHPSLDYEEEHYGGDSDYNQDGYIPDFDGQQNGGSSSGGGSSSPDGIIRLDMSWISDLLDFFRDPRIKGLPTRPNGILSSRWSLPRRHWSNSQLWQQHMRQLQRDVNRMLREAARLNARMLRDNFTSSHWARQSTMASLRRNPLRNPSVSRRLSSPPRTSRSQNQSAFQRIMDALRSRNPNPRPLRPARRPRPRQLPSNPRVSQPHTTTSDTRNSSQPTRRPLRSHTVVEGDTLWAIAEQVLGDGRRYNEIARLNNISNPNMIFPGETLRFSDM